MIFIRSVFVNFCQGKPLFPSGFCQDCTSPAQSLLCHDSTIFFKHGRERYAGVNSRNGNRRILIEKTMSFFPIFPALYPMPQDHYPECVVIILFPGGTVPADRTDPPAGPGYVYALFSQGLTGGERTNVWRDLICMRILRHGRGSPRSGLWWRGDRDSSNNRIILLTNPFFSCRFFSLPLYQDHSEYPFR
jgi:hypothetical protein